MVWLKRGSNQWVLYIDGENAGYVVKTKHNDGKIVYSGVAMYKKKLAVSKAVVGTTLAPVKDRVFRLAKAQRK